MQKEAFIDKIILSYLTPGPQYNNLDYVFKKIDNCVGHTTSDLSSKTDKTTEVSYLLPLTLDILNNPNNIEKLKLFVNALEKREPTAQLNLTIDCDDEFIFNPTIATITNAFRLEQNLKETFPNLNPTIDYVFMEAILNPLPGHSFDSICKLTDFDFTVDVIKKVNALSKNSPIQDITTVLVDEKQMFSKGGLESVKNSILALPNQGKDLNIAFDCSNKQLFTKDELLILDELNQFCQKNANGKELSFQERKSNWSFEQVINANKNIDKLANEIKSKNFSPLESLMYAYEKISKVTYCLEEPNQSESISRSIFGIFNSNNICCVGYANWLKAVMDKLELPGLTLFSNKILCSTPGESTKSGHATNIAYLKDEKYGIDGFYYLDTCADSGKQLECASSNDLKSIECDLSHFLLPLKELQYMRNKLSHTSFMDRQTFYKQKDLLSVGSIGGAFSEESKDLISKILKNKDNKLTSLSDAEIYYKLLEHSTPLTFDQVFPAVVKTMDEMGKEIELTPTQIKEQTIDSVKLLRDKNRGIFKQDFASESWQHDMNFTMIKDLKKSIDSSKNNQNDLKKYEHLISFFINNPAPEPTNKAPKKDSSLDL